jgi:hypothetical protein
MCYGCWQEMGKPAMRSPSIEEAAQKIERLYDEFCCDGGNLHVVTDDWNLEDCYVQFCKQTVDRILTGKIERYDDINPPQVALEKEVLDLLMPMSEAERGAALALANQYEAIEHED